METRVAVRGEIDLASAPDLLRRLDEAVDRHPGETVVVDLTRVTFVDSSGLGVLVVAGKRAQARGGRVLVDGCTASVRRVLDVTGLGKLLLAPPVAA